jgi:hypothetical protein
MILTIIAITLSGLACAVSITGICMFKAGESRERWAAATMQKYYDARFQSLNDKISKAEKKIAAPVMEAQERQENVVLASEAEQYINLSAIP